MKIRIWEVLSKSICAFCLFSLEAKADVCQGESCPNQNQIPHVCGNGVCQADCGENSQTCFADCGPRCGDGVCSSTLGENTNTCVIDCGRPAFCGDGVCSTLTESCATCYPDCGVCTPSTTTTTCPTTTTTTCPPMTTTTTTPLPTTTTTTTIPNQCQFYKANVKMTGTQGISSNSENQTNSTINNWRTSAANGPSCLQNEIDKTLAAGLKMVQVLNTCIGGYPASLRDDYALHMLLGKNMKDGVGNTIITKNLLNPAYCKYGENAYYPPFTAKSTCLRNTYVHPKSPLWFCAESVSYFDANCQAVDSSVAIAACGSSFLGQSLFIGILSTPISFIWEKDADIEQNISIVDFPLDPTKVGKKWLWKGSEKTPLLVYDPLHQGEITSATQLFGNWTFGGRRVASLIDSAAKQWNNGYEALKTLDSNGDGVLSGKEIKTLALWFDKNSDSISSAGEVIDATSLRIKKIYFNPDKKDPITGNITASLGFEREVNGKIVRGSSVDWFTPGAERKLELLLRQNNLSKRSEIKEINKKPEDKDSSYAAEFGLEELSKRSGPLTGIWKWRFENEHSREALGNDGFLIIKDSKIDGISGYSMVETAFGDGKKVASAVLMYLIQGQKTFSNQGQEIRFSTEMGNGNTVSNVAKIKDDNKTLVGESTAIVKDQNGIQKTISYRWNATKYEM